MKKYIDILVMALVAMSLSCCSKGLDEYQTTEQESPEMIQDDTNMVQVELEAGSIENDTKVTVNGTTTSWVKGDKVAVFVRPAPGSSAYPAYPFTVSAVSGDYNKTAKLTGRIPEGAKPFLYAVYPYDENAGSDWSGNIKNYTIPAIQDGSFSNVVFHGTPEEIKSDSDKNKKYTFKAISGIVKLTVPAALNVKAIVLTSTDTNKELAGTFDINSNGTISSSSISNKSKNITVVARDGEILSGDVYVAVLPQASGTTFTLSMNVINKDLKYASFSKSGMKALVKGQIEKLGTLPSTTVFNHDAREFSAGLNNTNKILFSPGLLQYQPANGGTWRFAPDQLTFIGNNPGNNTPPTSISDESNRAEMTDWIDLFPYGNNSYNGYMPYACLSETKSKYFYTIGQSLINYYAAYDWGANAIQNGDSTDEANIWHTPSYKEFQYIMSIDGNTRNTLSGVHYCRVVIDGTILGTLLFPDLFIFPDAVPKPTLSPNPFDYQHGNWTVNAWNITMAQFNALQANGAVILPNAGYRVKAVSNEGTLTISFGETDSPVAHYWTSTATQSLYISNGNLGYDQTWGCDAFPVRLVKDVK